MVLTVLQVVEARNLGLEGGLDGWVLLQLLELHIEAFQLAYGPLAKCKRFFGE